MPFVIMGKEVRMIGSLSPFTHMAVWLKQVILTDAFKIIDLSSLPQNLQDNITYSLGANTIPLIEASIPLWSLILIGGGIGLGCLILSIFLLKRRISK